MHLNCQFVEPLLPDPDDVDWPEGRAAGRPWTEVDRLAAPTPVELSPGPRTVVVAGDDAGPPARLLAERAGWPLLAEPSSGARTGTHAIASYRLLLGHPDLGGRIERVVAYGHPTLSRSVSRLLSRDDVELVVVDPGGRWNDPGQRAARVVSAATVDTDEGDTDDAGAGDWLAGWRAADAVATEAIAKELASEPGLTPYDLARIVSESVPPRGLLVVGSSHPIRDLDLMAVAPPVGERRRVVANRGLSGIDGTVSTAIGAALGRRRTSRALAYVGDLTFLHDANGLLVGPDEPRPDLTIVVADDDGGSIFAVIEPGGPDHVDAFERVFGTPTGTDVATLCAAHGVPCVRVADAEALRAALGRTPEGIEVVDVALDRANRRNLDGRLRSAVKMALARAR